MMEIDKTSTYYQCAEEALNLLSYAELPIHTHNCPHCGCPVRYPIIAREADIKNFEELMNTAYEVMDKYGITANIYAEIIAKCQLKIIQNKKNSS